MRANNPSWSRSSWTTPRSAAPDKPEDIVGPAMFLASDMAAYITGTIVMADGGYRAI